MNISTLRLLTPIEQVRLKRIRNVIYLLAFFLTLATFTFAFMVSSPRSESAYFTLIFSYMGICMMALIFVLFLNKKNRLLFDKLKLSKAPILNEEEFQKAINLLASCQDPELRTHFYSQTVQNFPDNYPFTKVVWDKLNEK